jgi:hypothetical protein
MHVPRSTRSTPERSCIITREAQPKEGLLRFVVSPDGVLVLDVAGKLPGRGLYVTATRLLLAEAIAKKAFARAAKQPVTIPDGFLEFVGYQLRQRLLDALSMARKAGQAISGFDKIEEALAKGKVIGLLHASDAGDDGVKKLQKDGLESFRFFPRGVLSRVMGKENAVHVALLEGSAAAFFIENARRFALFLE